MVYLFRNVSHFTLIKINFVGLLKVKLIIIKDILIFQNKNVFINAAESNL